MSTSIKQLPLSRAAKNTLAITYVPIDQLKPDARNARVHSKKQIRQIARSIESFGFNVPVLVGANLNVSRDTDESSQPSTSALPRSQRSGSII